jgi:hypothetical protein
MPKVAMNYKNTIIYKIVCNDLNITNSYVGHTTNFTKRKHQHHYNCCNENSKSYNLLVYQKIRSNGNWENWSMIEVEKYSCDDVNEALSRERYWLEILKADLNKLIPTRTSKEFYKDNKEYWNQYQKTDKQKAYQKEYYKSIKEKKQEQIQCDCGSIYNKYGKSKHLQTKKHKNNLIYN